MNAHTALQWASWGCCGLILVCCVRAWFTDRLIRSEWREWTAGSDAQIDAAHARLDLIGAPGPRDTDGPVAMTGTPTVPPANPERYGRHAHTGEMDAVTETIRLGDLAA